MTVGGGRREEARRWWQRHKARKKASQEQYIEVQGPAGETPGNPPLWPPTNLERVHHGARQAQRGINGGRRGK